MSLPDLLPEVMRQNIWRMTIWQTDPELHPLGPRHSVEVYCCEEANGFAVWYVRRLPHAEQRDLHGVENGDYLLSYFSRDRRDDAITRAVLISHGATTPELQIAALDRLALQAQKV